jgi:hypothetical protein
MGHRSSGAYMWLSLAVAREPDAVGEREAAASQMTPEGEADPGPMIRKALLEPLMADKPGLRFNRQRGGSCKVSIYSSSELSSSGSRCMVPMPWRIIPMPS